jgi:hypothetical protein
MSEKNRTLKIFISFIIISILLIQFNCKKGSGNGIFDPEVEVGKGFLTVLPINQELINIFVNLGHLSPPGHTFPSDHGGFYFTNWEDPIPVFSPSDMKITEMSLLEHITTGKSDYDMTLSVNNGGFSVVFGHLSSISHSILEQAPSFEDGRCDTYIAGGDEYRRCSVNVSISVLAGDTLGTAGGPLGQWSMDFGTFDINKKTDFANNRFNDSKFPYTVSPLDYFTEEIESILIPLCGDYICGFRMIRTEPPIGGTIGYDVPGTSQGLWFKQGESTFPEDPHMALVYDCVEPHIPVFSVGIGIPNLSTGIYTFTPADSGKVNRLFIDVTPDNQVYRYEIRDRCFNAPAFDAVILLQMVSEEELRIEKQESSEGPPWTFTENAVHYVR